MPLYEYTVRVTAPDLPTAIATFGRIISARQVDDLAARPGEPAAPPESQHQKATAAQIRASTRPDTLISFEDGKPYKTLKRHLAGVGLTMAEYRAKWGLPDDYPGTAPEYSARRSELAKANGLGRKR